MSNGNDEEMDLNRYKAAAAELETGTRDEGLWLKAFSESGGNESATKAAYIRLRVEQLRKSAVAEAAKKFVGSGAQKPNPANYQAAKPTNNTATQNDAANVIAPKLGPARVAQTLYDIVGVAPDADVTRIAAAIEAQLKTMNAAPIGDHRITLLLHAKEVLLDSGKRQTYDKRIFSPPKSATPSVPSSGNLRRSDNATDDANAEPLAPELATLGMRFKAAAIDWGVIIGVAGVLSLFGSAGAKAAALPILIFLAYQFRGMRDKGQTIGKQAIGIRVVGSNTGEIPSVANGIILRAVVPLVAMFGAGMFHDILFWVVFALDTLPILGEQRKCLHDLIADTEVVVVST